ncbi:unnamed protein product [Fusarium langsethiae]|nr:unnamed protein product [Fusarium langsethiae]
MNSTRNSVAGVEVFDLTDNANDLSSQSLPRIPNSLSRRCRQGGATFTANCHGVFERTRKRRRSDDLTIGHKQARLESTRKSIHYDAVYQNQRAVKKHVIVRRPTDDSQHAKFYIIRCDQHDISFDNKPLQDALTHLRSKHGILTASHDTVIECLGIKVIGCDDQKLEQNNTVAQKALQDGTNALGRDSIRVMNDDDSNRSELPKSKRNCQKRSAAKQKHVRNPTRSHQPYSQLDKDDTPLDLVPGNVYIIWWFETKQWFAGLLIPPQNLESVGIHNSLEKLAIFKTLPACYQYDTSSKSLSWAEGYEDGGPKSSERYYPFIFFEGFKFPNDCHQAWIQMDNIKPWDDDKTVYIEHRDQAVKFIRERREGKKLESQRPEIEAEISDSMGDDESSENVGSGDPYYDENSDDVSLENDECRDSDHDENSDVDEFEHSSPLAESSTDNQAVPEPNVATPDTIDEPEVAAELEEVSNKTTVDPAHDTQQSDESDEEMIDASDDMDDSPAPEASRRPMTTVPLPELPLQRERVPKDPDDDPEQTTRTQESPIQYHDEMDIVLSEDTGETEGQEDINPSDDDLDETGAMAMVEEVLHNGNKEAQKDIFMTKPCGDHSTTKEHAQCDRRTVAKTHDDLAEETAPAGIPETDTQYIAESEDDDASQHEDLANQTNVDRRAESVSRQSPEGSRVLLRDSNEKPQATFTRRSDQNCWTNDDIRRIIDGALSERGTIEGGSSDIQSTAEPIPVQELAVVKESASTRVPVQDLDLDSLLKEGESLELHMSQAQPAASCQPSPTSSDDNRLAEEIFHALLSEDRQSSTPKSPDDMNYSNGDAFRPRAPLAGIGGRYFASSPPTSEERSQPSPYAQMGEPASVHSRPVSKGSDVRQPSYEETGTPASVLRRLSTASNARRNYSNGEMGQRAHVASRPLTGNGDIPRQRSYDTGTGQSVSATDSSNHEPHLRNSTHGSMDQIRSAQPRLSSRELESRPQVVGTAIRQSPLTSHSDTRPTAETSPVQMPLRSAATHQKTPANPSKWLQQVTTSPPESHVQVSKSTLMPPGIQAIISSQQSANAPNQGSGVSGYPHSPHIAGTESSQSIPTSEQNQKPVNPSSYPPAVADSLPSPTTQSFPISHLPSSTQQSVRDILRFLHQTDSSARQPGHDARLPPSGVYPDTEAHSRQLGQQWSSATFKTPAVGNSHTFQEAVRSPQQHVIQSPPSSYQNPSVSQVMPSPRPSNSSISRTSSLSQGYVVPPPQPLPSPCLLAGEVLKALSNTQDFRVQPSPNQPVRELARSHTATYGQPRPNTAASSPYITTSLPPPSTLAQGPPSLQVSASPRLQAMEISRPSSAAHESRTPTSPRQYAMRFSQPASTNHGASVDTAASPRVTLMSTSRPGSFVQGQSSSVNASPQLAAKEISRPSSTIYGQRTQPTMSSPRNTSIAMSQPAPPAHGHVYQPPSSSSPRLPAAQSLRHNTVDYSHSGPQTMSSPQQSRPGLPKEPSRPGSRVHHSNSSNGPLPPPQPRVGNYVPATITHQSRSPPIQAHNNPMSHSHRQSHTASQSYSYGNGPETRNSTPRSHAPAYQVPVQPLKPAVQPGPLHAYLPPQIAEALKEQAGRRGGDIKPGDFLNYQNIIYRGFVLT